MSNHPAPWVTRHCDCQEDCPRYLIVDMGGEVVAHCINYAVALACVNAVNRLHAEAAAGVAM